MDVKSKVYKFGGASVKNAEAVKNVVDIIKQTSSNLVVVVSAMAKSTNAFEEVIRDYFNGSTSNAVKKTQDIIDFHYSVIEELSLVNDSSFMHHFEQLVSILQSKLNGAPSSNYDFEYDQIVSFGELFSTTIVSGYLSYVGISNKWVDARKIIRTNKNHRKAKVNWEETQKLINELLLPRLETTPVVVTQGFIGHNKEDLTTTLGREGSDFSAGILAFCLGSSEVVIWKDVPGMLNADPKYFSNCKKLNQISYREAIELSYFGASVIHPKTIKPLQNKLIPLKVKSFISPEEKGTLISERSEEDSLIPSYIFKENQLLVSISPKDFSFVVEHNLSEIFNELALQKVTVNLMQNSALSFSFCSDDSNNLRNAIKELQKKYSIKYNEKVSLLTVRHYTESVLQTLLEGHEVFVEQKSRHTARYVIKQANEL